MEKKRKYCGHCDEFVNLRTYRLHLSLYFDEKNDKWRRTVCKQSDESSSSDDDQNKTCFTFVDEISDESEGRNQCCDFPHEQVNVEGAFIEELENEDIRLTGKSNVCTENDDWLYMEKEPARIQCEIWELDESDLNLDFEENQGSSQSIYHEVEEQRMGHLVRWMLIFLCVWSSYCCISENALDILVYFIHTTFLCISTIIPPMAGIALIFPKSLNLLKRSLGIEKDRFTKYVVCTKCDSIYRFDECFFEQFGRTVIKNCPYVAHENHRQHFRRTACSNPLLKEVTLKNGKKRLYPYKVYCYNSVITTLKDFISRKGFVANCERWRNRNIPSGLLADIFDGRVWKEFMYIERKPFLAAERNYGLMLNVDWFQPFKHSVYSVGAIYMVVMNLPRELRFKPENTILVGIIPGPHEPKLTINSYLKPLVDDLKILWNEGIAAKPPDCSTNEKFRAALLCVGCDVPAARKVCGFTGHTSCHGCSKCKKQFPGNVSERMDFSGFEQCEPRTNKEHRAQAVEILKQTTATDKASKETEFGTRYSELMRLPYFNCVRFHIIDPMHNLFTGTAKHIMKNVWLSSEISVIDLKKLNDIQAKIDNVTVPSCVGRLPKKISNSYGGFTADQWRSWTIIYSIFALWDILPEADMNVWCEFVLACNILCSNMITTTKAQLGHCHLMKFCTTFQELYGKSKVTPNMHLHMHILDCILDFGPVYAFWLFSFERYNGILGVYSSNQRSVEIQIMRRFLSDQFVKAIPVPTTFKDYFTPLLDRMKSNQSGTLKEYSSAISDDISNHLSQLNRLSIGPVMRGLHWIMSDNFLPLVSFCTPITRYSIDLELVPDLKIAYSKMLDNVDLDSITERCEKLSGLSVGGEDYGSLETRKDRLAFILARWCADFQGKIDSSGMDLRPGVIKYFLRQNIKINGNYQTCVLAAVKWFKKHPARYTLRQPSEVWCKDLFEDDGPAQFIPFQRIYCKFVPAFDVVKKEHVLITCPLPRKLQC